MDKLEPQAARRSTVSHTVMPERRRAGGQAKPEGRKQHAATRTPAKLEPCPVCKAREEAARRAYYWANTCPCIAAERYVYDCPIHGTPAKYDGYQQAVQDIADSAALRERSK